MPRLLRVRLLPRFSRFSETEQNTHAQPVYQFFEPLKQSLIQKPIYHFFILYFAFQNMCYGSFNRLQKGAN